jgi:hypothetical protein
MNPLTLEWVQKAEGDYSLCLRHSRNRRTGGILVIQDRVVADSGVCIGLACFSDEEPGTQGPRRISKKELKDAFTKGWAIESIQPVRFEIRPDFKDMAFSEGGPKAWFAVVRRE